jgi:hypothetical protein
MTRQRRIRDRADGRIKVQAADVRVGETIVYPRDAYFSFEVEEAEGCQFQDEPAIRFRHSTGSTVYAERDLVWVAS